MKENNTLVNESSKLQVELSNPIKIGNRPPIYPVRDIDRSRDLQQHINRSSEAENLVQDQLDSHRYSNHELQAKRNLVSKELSHDHSPATKRPTPLEVSLSNKFEGGGGLDSQSVSSSTESPRGDKDGKHNRTMFQRFRNLRGLYNSQVYLASTFLLTVLYFAICLIKTISDVNYTASLGINNETYQ
jgi:hypothetical protein